jgi:hypothetical protein
VAKDTRGTAAKLLSSAPPPPRPAEPTPEVAVPAPGPPAEPGPAREPEPATASAETASSLRPAPAKRPATSRPKRAPAPPTALIPLRDQPVTQMRIPAALFERLRQAKSKTGDTHETWFLDAFDAVSDQLDEVYGPGPQRRTRMPVRRRRTRRPTNDLLVAYPLRLTDEEIAVLQERAAEVGPPSMAEFVTTIVQLRLEQLEHGEQ